MLKRFTLFILTNILVMIVGSFIISFLLNFFGFGSILASGGKYTGILVICFLWGMIGSFISLWISKWMAKRAYGVQIVSATGTYSGLVQTVHQLSRKAGIEVMPEVGIYPSDDVNAFATGASKNSSMVAVSTGLLQKMGNNEVEGVLGHEVAHIANGDMVTMTLVQGVVNAFVMFFSHLATIAVDNILRGDDDEGGGLGFLTGHLVYMAFNAIFGLLAAPIVMGFSRFREFKADESSARLAGKDKMIKALEALARNYPQLGEPAEKSMRSMQISSKSSLLQLFSSHPTLEKRIANLKNRPIL